MRVSTALNHCSRFESRMRDLYASARRYGWSHAYLLERIGADVYEDPAWSKVPSWVQNGRCTMHLRG